MLPDIILRRDESGDFAFIPHSRKADDFLSKQFSLIGDRDLTMQDVDVILRRAELRGLVVRDLMRNPDGDIMVARAELRCGTREEIVRPNLRIVK